MNIFNLRDNLIKDNFSCVWSFFHSQDERIYKYVENAIHEGLLCPEPLIQMYPAFEAGKSINELVNEGIFHPEWGTIFRKGKTENSIGESSRMHKHQEEAIRITGKNENFVLI